MTTTAVEEAARRRDRNRDRRQLPQRQVDRGLRPDQTCSGLDWVIVAEIATDEALAPVEDFTRKLAISSAILVGVVSLISVIIAGSPCGRCAACGTAARRIAAGERACRSRPARATNWPTSRRRSTT